jgi:protein AroM
MNKKIGIITIGQSPRTDVVPEMSALFGEGVEVLECGALDGLSFGPESRKL